MIGKGLAKKVLAGAIVAACGFVAVVALHATLFYLLLIVLVPAAAAAITALVAALVAVAVAMAFKTRPSVDEEDEEDDEPAGLGVRAYDLFRNRPVLGTAAALAGGWIFLRNPALATMVAAAFTEKSRRFR